MALAIEVSVVSVFRVIRENGANCWRGMGMQLVAWLHLLHLLLLLQLLLYCLLLLLKSLW